MELAFESPDLGFVALLNTGLRICLEVKACRECTHVRRQSGVVRLAGSGRGARGERAHSPLLLETRGGRHVRRDLSSYTTTPRMTTTSAAGGRVLRSKEETRMRAHGAERPKQHLTLRARQLNSALLFLYFI